MCEVPAAMQRIEEPADESLYSHERNGEKIFIVAGNFCQAVEYCVRNGFLVNEIGYVNSKEKLFGIEGRGKKLYFVGTYYKRDDYIAIEELAEMRGFSIVYAQNY